MKNKDLATLNFHDLIDYGGQPIVENIYSVPKLCLGYCTHCEDSGLLSSTTAHLDQMSHAADTSDYEYLLGPMPLHERKVEYPVLFLLENPGGNYGNGDPVPWRDYMKRPPIHHYYWSPSGNSWPRSTSSLPNHYGPYFAYLMQQHGICDAYITNVYKCNWQPKWPQGLDTARIIKNCIGHFLIRELEILQPQVALCFGRKAESWLGSIRSQCQSIKKIVYLYHPAAIDLAARYHMTSEEMLEENDKRIAEVFSVV